MNAANDRIFLYSGTATGGITLLSGEWLIGQGATGASFDSFFSITPPSGTIARPNISGTRPTISPSSGAAVTLNVNNKLQGFNVSAPAGIVGADVDTLLISELNLTSTAGLALSLAGGTNMSVAIGTLSATNGAGGGVNLSNNTGTTTLGSVVISNTGGTGLSASSAGTLVIGGTTNTITTTTGTALSVTSTTIGSAGWTFKSIAASGGTNGIVLNNTAALGSLAVTGNGNTGAGWRQLRRHHPEHHR